PLTAIELRTSWTPNCSTIKSRIAASELSFPAIIPNRGLSGLRCRSFKATGSISFFCSDFFVTDNLRQYVWQTIRLGDFLFSRCAASIHNRQYSATPRVRGGTTRKYAHAAVPEVAGEVCGTWTLPLLPRLYSA